jgi:uncharacterized protein with HEPN domain
MSRRDLVYVAHMLGMAKRAVSKIHGISRKTDDADEHLRLAMIRPVQTIGEAARQVSREFCSNHSDIRWRYHRHATRSYTSLASMMTSCGKSSPRTHHSWLSA